MTRGAEATKLTCPKCGRIITVFVPFIEIHCTCGARIQGEGHQTRRTDRKRRGKIIRLDGESNSKAKERANG